MFIVLFHELGHVLVCLFFKYKIINITIYPFGGITKIEKDINTNSNKELILAFAGIFMQIILIFIVKLFSIHDYELFLKYNYSIMLFNLIPIIPLDGSKIINVFFCKIFPYKKALFLSFKLSVLFLILTIFYEFYYFNFLLFIWTILLILENKKEKQFLLLKFYLFLKERMEHQYQFPYCYEKINNVDRIKRDVHCIFQNQYTERDVIKRYFHYEIR